MVYREGLFDFATPILPLWQLASTLHYHKWCHRPASAILLEIFHLPHLPLLYHQGRSLCAHLSPSPAHPWGTIAHLECLVAADSAFGAWDWGSSGWGGGLFRRWWWWRGAACGCCSSWCRFGFWWGRGSLFWCMGPRQCRFGAVGGGAWGFRFVTHSCKSCCCLICPQKSWSSQWGTYLGSCADTCYYHSSGTCSRSR